MDYDLMAQSEEDFYISFATPQDLSGKTLEIKVRVDGAAWWGGIQPMVDGTSSWEGTYYDTTSFLNAYDTFTHVITGNAVTMIGVQVMLGADDAVPGTNPAEVYIDDVRIIDAAPVDTPTPTETSTGPVDTPTETPTTGAGCTPVYQDTYTFDAGDECWFTEDLQSGTTLEWLDNASAPAGANGGVLHGVVPFGTNVSGGNYPEGFSLLLPSNVDLSGKRIQARVYVDGAVQGTAWGGGMQVNVGTGSDASVWCAPWTNIMGFDGWYTYQYDLTGCATADDVKRLGVQIVMAAGCLPGDVYIDSFEIVDIPTPTPTPAGCVTILFNGLESLTENGSWIGTSATRSVVAAPPEAITEGSSCMQVDLTATGWDQEAMNVEGFAPTVWGSYTKLMMDIYIPAATWNSWAQIQFIASSDSSGWDQALNGSGDVALHVGMNHVVWDIDWSGAAATQPTDNITRIYFVLNGNMVVPNPIYVDNMQLESCP